MLRLLDAATGTGDRLLGRRHERPLTGLEDEAVEEVRSLALDYDRSPAKLMAVTQSTTPRQRALAISHMTPGDPAWAPLCRLLDDLIAAQQGYVTKHGIF